MFLLEYGVVSVYTWHERAIYRKLRKEPSRTIRPESLRMSVRDITLWWHVKHCAVTQQTQNWSPEWAQVIFYWCWRDLKPPCHGNTGQHPCWSKVQKIWWQARESRRHQESGVLKSGSKSSTWHRKPWANM